MTRGASHGAMPSDAVTKRDDEILQLAAAGVGPLSIAVRLSVPHSTVTRVIADARLAAAARDRGAPWRRPRSVPSTR